MPIRYIDGDIFDSTTQVIVNTVNCKGVMGKGLALKFKRRYPRMYREYRTQCMRGLLSPGKLHLYKTPKRWILNFPTKDDWRRKSKIEYIEAGLKTFVHDYKKLGIRSITFPRLGCELGGLEWRDVKGLMEDYLSELSDLEVFVYTYPVKTSRSRQETLSHWQ